MIIRTTKKTTITQSSWGRWFGIHLAKATKRQPVVGSCPQAPRPAQPAQIYRSPSARAASCRYVGSMKRTSFIQFKRRPIVRFSLCRSRIHDAQREDIVTFVFQLWLFVLALVTVRSYGHSLEERVSDASVDPQRVYPPPYRGRLRPYTGYSLVWIPRVLHEAPKVSVQRSHCPRGLR